MANNLGLTEFQEKILTVIFNNKSAIKGATLQRLLDIDEAPKASMDWSAFQEFDMYKTGKAPTSPPATMAGPAGQLNEALNALIAMNIVTSMRGQQQTIDGMKEETYGLTQQGRKDVGRMVTMNRPLPGSR